MTRMTTSSIVLLPNLPLIQAVITLTVGVLVSGCTTYPWDVKRFYNGPERPLEEVAVLCRTEDIHIEEIDEIDAYYPFETNLLPGRHSIMVLCYGSGITVENVAIETITWDFMRGHVYILMSETFTIPIPSEEIRQRDSITITKDGLVDICCRAKLLDLGTDYHEVVKELCKHSGKTVPDHWREFLEE